MKNKKKTQLTLPEQIVAFLSEGKATDITVIDMDGKSDVADFVIIASGTSTKHVSSIASNLMTQLKPLTNFLSVEGMTNAEWVLVDTGDIVIHLFKYDIRELYDLEKLWKTNPKARLHED